MAPISFFDWLTTASRRLKVVVGISALVVFGGVGYFIAVFPVSSRVVALRAQRNAQQQELTRLRGMATELTRARREAAEVERQLERAKAKLPTEREIPALYRTLSDAAAQAGLAVALFRPQAPRIHDFYSEVPISVIAEGGYHEVGNFIGRVASLPRATMIGELKLTGAAAEGPRRTMPPGPGGAPRPPVDGSRPRGLPVEVAAPKRPVRTEMTLLTYVYRPVGSPPAPKPSGASAKPEPSKP